MAKQGNRDKKATGQDFLARVLEQVPEAQRATVAAALQNDTVVDLVGEHVLLKDDYSRKADEAEEAKKLAIENYNQNKKWWDEKQTELYTLRAQIAAGGSKPAPEGDPDPAPAAKPPAATLPADVLRRTDLDNFAGAASRYMRYMITLSSQHLQDWKEPLDVDALEAHCQKIGRTVDQGGYESFTQEKREARAQKTAKEREEQIRKEEREKVLKEIGTSSSGVLGVTDAPPSFSEGTLAGLNKDNAGKFGVDAAVRGLHQRRAAKGA